MELIADESVDFGIIALLRKKGIVVISITEDFPRADDTKVLEIANNKELLLLTEDKDFGELAYRLKLNHKGILLIRLSALERKNRIDLVAESIEKYFKELKNNFSVIIPCMKNVFNLLLEQFICRENFSIKKSKSDLLGGPHNILRTCA